jgi:oxygen-independent coproporphyrinogen III oxidase
MPQPEFEELIRKYNRPVPRYTSYPTVPYWNDNIEGNEWKENFRRSFNIANKQDGMSLYLHLPFCETLCTYCGCNKKITRNHSVEEEYLDVIIREWKLYRALMDERPLIREIHLGGGTPTFFSPRNLARLLDSIFEDANIHTEHEFSIEGHPNNTTKNHLDTLHALGFRRISFGVQDNDPEVQRIINRIQPLKNVKDATENARMAGFTSINYDLVYGLPKQTVATMKKTISEILELRPDRIAFYSYAHVPWTSRGQRLFDETDLPSPELKMELYLLGKKMFAEGGYNDIAMDHFALPADELFRAKQEGRLHRNFMGYTTQRSAVLLGLGVSSISDTGTAFAQNEKSLHDYYERIGKAELAVVKGIFLDDTDTHFRKYILDLSCKGRTEFNEVDGSILHEYCFPQLRKFEADGLVNWNYDGLQVTQKGWQFIRNICSAFDLYLLNTGEPTKPMYSKAI